MRAGTEPNGPTTRELRIWGVSTGAALCLLGGLVLWRRHAWGWAPILLGLAIVLIGVTAVRPVAVPVQRAWQRFADFLLQLWTRLALFLAFVVAVVPIALIGRLTGRDRLRLRFPGRRDSYWEKHSRGDRPDHYRKQF